MPDRLGNAIERPGVVGAGHHHRDASIVRERLDFAIARGKDEIPPAVINTGSQIDMLDHRPAADRIKRFAWKPRSCHACWYDTGNFHVRLGKKAGVRYRFASSSSGRPRRSLSPAPATSTHTRRSSAT